MNNTNVQEFLNTLTEEQRAAVLACKTEEDLEKVMDEYDIEIPDEMLAEVTGGKNFMPAFLAAVMMLSSGSAIAANAAPVAVNEPVTGIVLDIDAMNKRSYALSSYGAMSEAEQRTANEALKIAKNVGCEAISQYIPGGSIISSLLGGVLDFAMEEDGPSIEDVQDDISELRDHLDEKVDEIKDAMDTNTSTICQTVENSICLGNKGVSLTGMMTTTEQFNMQIEKYKSKKNVSEEDKIAFIASRIRKSGDWGDNGNNLIYEVAEASKALSGTDLIVTNSSLQAKDAFMSAYKLACRDAMFSGDAYDAAVPYANHIMTEYMNSFNTAMECLLAAKELANFTPEQVAALSAEGRANYDLACKDEALIDTEIYYLTNLALNSDSKDSVISHYAAFMYARDNDRNVFVNNNGNGDGIAISPTLSVNSMPCGMPKYADYYYYSEFETRYDKVKSSTKQSVKDAANSSAIKADQIDKMRKFAYSKGMSFNQYLNTMGIKTDYASDCYFPISNAPYESGDKVAHKGGAPSKEMNIQMLTFDASKKDAGSEHKTVYTIKSWNDWRNAIKTIYWSCVRYNKDEPSCKMLNFKECNRNEIPKTAKDVMNSVSNSISYSAHVQGKGWMDTVTSKIYVTETAGTTGQALRMEAFKINLNNSDGSSAVQYRANVQGKGWQTWCNSGEVAGTEGQCLRIEELEIKLTGEYANKYDVVYRVHWQDLGWTGWVKNGQTAGTNGQGKRAEAIEIKLVPKS